MRTFMALIIALLVFVVPVMAQSVTDEAAVREAAKRANAAYNSHDIETFSEIVDEHTENWTGAVKGKAAIKESALQAWERQKDGQWRFIEEIGVVFVTSDVAIYKTRYETSGFLDDTGNPEPPATNLVALVMVKRNGKWLQNVFLSRREE